MALLVRKSSVGLTWAPDGICRGVHLRRSGSKCTVYRHWQGTPEPGDSPAARLGQGVRELGATEGTVVALGGTTLGFGAVDLTLPKLPVADLKNALSFELAKHAPIPVEKLVWGCRVLGDLPGRMQRIRLLYMRETDWDRWLRNATGVRQGIDVIIPPACVVDPLLAGQAICLRGTNGHDAAPFVFRPDEHGGRTIEIPTSDDTALGSAGSPFAADVLNPGTLADASADQRSAFGPALMLAMYGLTRNVDSDQKTWQPVPYEMRPKRYRLSRTLASALVILLLCLGGLGFWREYQVTAGELNELRAKVAAVEDELTQLQGDQDAPEFIESLRDQLARAHVDRPTMTAALVELTELIQNDWVDTFYWREGTIEIQLRTDSEDLDFAQMLDDSPLLGDVVPGTTVNNPTYGLVRKFRMTARYDTDVEISNRRERAPTPEAELPPGPVDPEEDPAEEPEDEVEEDGADVQTNTVPMPPPPPPALPSVGN